VNSIEARQDRLPGLLDFLRWGPHQTVRPTRRLTGIVMAATVLTLLVIHLIGKPKSSRPEGTVPPLVEIAAARPAGPAGEDGGSADQARSLLLTAVGREPSDAASTVLEAWCGGSPRCPCRPDRARRRASKQVVGRGRDGEVYEKSLEMRYFRKGEKNGSNEDAWVYNQRRLGSQNGDPGSYTEGEMDERRQATAVMEVAPLTNL
jgi:hypothetical protein